MKLLTRKFAILAILLAPVLAAPAHGQIVVTEVSPTGSNALAYGADWFELTNKGSTAVSIAGWKMDDNSNSFASAVALRGLTSIAAGQTVVFIEGTASGSTDATINASFRAAWGAAATSIAIGNYGGSGVGLSAVTDEVNIFTGAGTQIAHVVFGASTTGLSFDNSTGLNNVTLTQVSVVGVNGAYTSALGGEIGSPGSIASVPEADGYVLALAGMGALGIAARRRRGPMRG